MFGGESHINMEEKKIKAAKEQEFKALDDNWKDISQNGLISGGPHGIVIGWYMVMTDKDCQQ